MKKNEKIALILMLLATAGTIIGIFAIETFRRKQLYTVELVSRSPLNGNWLAKSQGGGWQAKKFSVPFGKEVKLYIRNIETVSHGFSLPDFELHPHVNEIKAGEVIITKFKADKKGTFPFFCTVWCSNEHLHMSGEMTVE